MKKELKGFVIGVIVTTILTGSAVFAAGSRKNIEVDMNTINLKVNGSKVDADNILYRGTTFVPLRAVAEILGKEVGWDSKTNTVSLDDKGGKTEKPGPITIGQVPYNIKILEPNSIGTVYMETTYVNNTNYPMTGFSMTVLLKDKNEKTYLSSYDTVMPGETSPLFSTFGPSTMDPDDIEILTITIRAQNDNGKTLTAEYDTKLKTYDYMEY